MALNKAQLANQIKDILDNIYTADIQEDADPDDIRQQYATALADVIDQYVKSATVTFAPGTIMVTGSATAQANSAPLVIENTIS